MEENRFKLRVSLSANLKVVHKVLKIMQEQQSPCLLRATREEVQLFANAAQFLKAGAESLVVGLVMERSFFSFYEVPNPVEFEFSCSQQLAVLSKADGLAALTLFYEKEQLSFEFSIGKFSVQLTKDCNEKRFPSKNLMMVQQDLRKYYLPLSQISSHSVRQISKCISKSYNHLTLRFGQQSLELMNSSLGKVLEEVRLTDWVCEKEDFLEMLHLLEQDNEVVLGESSVLMRLLKLSADQGVQLYLARDSASPQLLSVTTFSNSLLFYQTSYKRKGHRPSPRLQHSEQSRQVESSVQSYSSSKECRSNLRPVRRLACIEESQKEASSTACFEASASQSQLDNFSQRQALDYALDIV